MIRRLLFGWLCRLVVLVGPQSTSGVGAAMLICILESGPDGPLHVPYIQLLKGSAKALDEGHPIREAIETLRSETGK